MAFLTIVGVHMMICQPISSRASRIFHADDKIADNFSLRTTVGADGTFTVRGAKKYSRSCVEENPRVFADSSAGATYF